MALLPRRKWTNSLAWSVWAQRRNNKRRAGGNVPPPPPLNQRYFTQLDGQSKHWRRIEPNYGQTTEATLECLFYGGSGSGFQMLAGKVVDRFYIGLQSGNTVVFGNGSSGGQSQTIVDLTKINHAKLVADGANVTFFVNGAQITQVAQSWSGLLDAVGFGSTDGSANFYDGILVSARVATDTVDNVYGLDANLDYDLPDGVTLGPELWAGQNYTTANNATASTIVGGSEWSVQTSEGEIGNFADGAAVQDFSTIIGKTYQYSVVSGEPVNLAAYRPSFAALSQGISSIIFTAQDTTTRIYVCPRTTNTVTFSSPTVREIPNSALIFENGSIDQSDRLLVTQNANTGFWGEDKWFDAIKSVTGQVTVPTPDSITIDEVGGTLAGVAIDAPAAPIRVTGDCDLISGKVDISVIPALAGVAASITQSGPFSFDLVSEGALGFKRAFSGGAQATITNIKVELRYDYATGANPETNTYSSEYSSEYS